MRNVFIEYHPVIVLGIYIQPGTFDINCIQIIICVVCLIDSNDIALGYGVRTITIGNLKICEQE